MELLISPDAKGYFQKAISFSGGMTTAEIEPSQKIFAEHLAPLVVEDHVKPYLSEAEEWLLSDAPEVRITSWDFPQETCQGFRPGVYPYERIPASLSG